MTAALAAAKVDVPVNVDHPELKGAEVHSRVQVTDSCNCFKFCLPCFGRKKKVIKSSERDTRVADTASTTLYQDHSPRHELTRRNSATDIVRSPVTDKLYSQSNQFQSVTVNVHCDHSPAQTPSSAPALLVEPASTDSSESTH